MIHDATNSTQLTSLASIAAGYPLRSSAETLEAGDVHLLQLKNVSADGEADWSGAARVTLPSRKDPVWLTDNDVVFVARGTKTFAYPLRNTPHKAVCAPQFFVLTNKHPDKVLSEFLAWQINQRPAQEYLQRAAQGTNMTTIRREALENLPLAIPSIRTQQMLVNLWRASQKERALLTQLIINRESQLEALAVSLHQSAVGEQS